MNERQKTAQRLTRELQAFGATVTSVLPLADGKHLRFWVSDYRKNELLHQMKEAGYEPVFLGMSPQMCIESYSMGLVKLPLPAERQPIHDDRTIRGDLADRAKAAAQKAAVEAMHMAIYGKQRK